MPMRTRAYSLPMCAEIERRPLWPALPPPVFTLSLAGARSSSSWKTKMSPLVDLEVALRLADRAAAVVHVGLRLQQQDAVRRRSAPSATRPWKRFFQGPSPWRSAMRSTAMKPTLWRWRAYSLPGLPRPTKSFMGYVTRRDVTGCGPVAHAYFLPALLGCRLGGRWLGGLLAGRRLAARRRLAGGGGLGVARLGGGAPSSPSAGAAPSAAAPGAGVGSSSTCGRRWWPP